MFETKSSSVLYQGPVFAVRRDEVTMPGGSTAARDVVMHPGAVAIAALNEKNEILLIKQYRHPVGRKLWELPAGLLDVKGELPSDTAGRELWEEAGYAAIRWQVLLDLVSSPGFCDESVRVFLATDLYQVPRPDGPDDEEVDLEMHWVSLPDAVKMVLSGEIVSASAVSGILAAYTTMLSRDRLRLPYDHWVDRPTAFGKVST